MMGNALLATAFLFVALLFYLMQECQFLIPYRALLWYKYAAPILIFGATLFLNLFAAFYLFSRKFLLKDTGQKLAHLEKQLRQGDTISRDLSERLRE